MPQPETFPFKHPSHVIISGQFMSGKTSLTQQVLRNLNIFEVEPKQIFDVHKYNSPWQAEFKNIKFTKVLPEDWNEETSTIIIIDDQLMEKTVLKETTNLFVHGTHHKNASIIFITQNLFYDDSNYRTMSYNATYIIIFKSLRSREQVEHFRRQIYGKKRQAFFLYTFSQCTNPLYGYIAVDLDPTTHNDHPLRTGIIPGEGQFVFIRK